MYSSVHTTLAEEACLVVGISDLLWITTALFTAFAVFWPGVWIVGVVACSLPAVATHTIVWNVNVVHAIENVVYFIAALTSIRTLFTEELDVTRVAVVRRRNSMSKADVSPPNLAHWKEAEILLLHPGHELL
jgi:hypothetical protein